MARDDWRLRIELAGAQGFLERLKVGLGSEADDLAKGLESHRFAVSHDEDTVFVYAASLRQAEQAREVVAAELRDLQLEPRELVVEHWLAEADPGEPDRAGADAH